MDRAPQLTPDFLAGGGDMGERIRAYDWAASEPGEPASWPQGLKTAVRLLLSTGHPMFIWWGPNLTQFYNDAYRRSIGPERHPSALGQHGRECWAEIWDLIGWQIEQVMSGGGHTWHENHLVPITRYGRREDVYWTYTYSPIDEPTAANGIGGVLVVCTETTAQVLAERRKDEFLAMLAHELRNPLAPIRNASSMLLRMPAADATTRAIGGLLERQVAHLTHLVDDLLDVSRITQGRIELQRQPLDLANAIELAIEAVQPLLKERQHEVANTPPAHPLYIDGDLTRIVQCIGNILTNAAKYTEPGGRIRISAGREGREAVMEVEDNGAGIPPDMLQAIFELFVQVDRTLDRSHGGLGIGLSVVKRLIQMHGGQVSAHSTGLGHGSTFRIRLPMIEAPVVTATSSQATRSLARRVLIVDDNKDAADSLAEVLKFESHTTEVAYGAREALERAATFAADIVLLDIGLPEMDGYEVARRLRASGFKGTLVALTGYGRADDIHRAHTAGFDAHLTKPVDFAELDLIFRQNGAA